MMAFPALMEIILLYIAVEVGLVDGIRAATTPIGTPISQIPLSLSSLKSPTVFKSLTDSQVILLPRVFFRTFILPPAKSGFLYCHFGKPLCMLHTCVRYG